MPRMAGAGIHWASAWICSVPGSRDLEIEITMVDTEEIMEDPAITAEEPAIIQTNLKEEAISRAGSSRTRNSSMRAMGSIMSQLGSKTRVVAATMFLQQARPSVQRN